MTTARVSDESGEFWRSFADGYDRLCDDPAEWAAVNAERDAEASALPDGLDHQVARNPLR